MYDPRLYAGGVYGVLLAEWELACETPLVIRNGLRLAYEDDAAAKTRYRNLRLRWQEHQQPANGAAAPRNSFAVTALHFGYEVHGGQVRTYHFVPPSSVRGALRAWTLRHLVDRRYYEALSPQAGPDQPDALAGGAAAAEASAHQALLDEGLAQRASGCELIASLFGLAADEGEAGGPANAGRLLIETGRFPGAALRPLDAGGAAMAAEAGPDNVRRTMAVRNPLDRITHASRHGGLHRYLEVARGQTFTVTLRIANPGDADLGLVGLWARELDDGLLRLGALASIGRGRVSLRRQDYALWMRSGAPVLQGQALLPAPTVDDGAPEAKDALAGLWRRCIVPPAALLQFAGSYLAEFTGDGRDVALS